MLFITMMIKGVFERIRMKSAAILKKLSFKIVNLKTNLYNCSFAMFWKAVLSLDLYITCSFLCINRINQCNKSSGLFSSSKNIIFFL